MATDADLNTISQRLTALSESVKRNFLSEAEARDNLAQNTMEHVSDLSEHINQLALRVQGIETAIFVIIQHLEDGGIANLQTAREALHMEGDDGQDR